MHIKRFTARSVAEAMKAVKAEFGDEALIMSTRGLGGSGLYEVVAAVDYDSPAARHAATASGRERSGTATAADISEIEAELKELKDICWELFLNRNAPRGESFARVEDHLVANGLDRRLAQKVLVYTFSRLGKEAAADEGKLRAFVARVLYGKISVSDPLGRPASGGERGCRALAFVGPTGVGKTTTIAKLASIYALKRKRRVALLTMDTYRIAAAEQLRTYGGIIGVPVEVAGGPEELAGLIRAHRDKDVVLIDTAGRAHRDSEHIGELAGLAGIDGRLRFNLVLSAASRDSVLYETVREFSRLPLDSLTFTKLDEAGVRGPVLNAAVMSGKPVAYLTTGQRVPEDIERATRERILDFLT
ncbi:MAG TPA: flagellar biosynthesis protein FlhF [Deltaproteobacteria bacterium]|nr:flagellar biosynthesis protein FlhF [Deltaproteobacteria bacterium]